MLARSSYSINLLYNSIDPLQIDNVNYIIDRIIIQNNNMMHIITENLINNMNTTNQTIVKCVVAISKCSTGINHHNVGNCCI